MSVCLLNTPKKRIFFVCTLKLNIQKYKIMSCILFNSLLPSSYMLLFFLHFLFPRLPPGAFDLRAQPSADQPASDELSQQQRKLPASVFRGQTRAHPVGRGPADAAGGGHQAAGGEEEASDSSEAPEEGQRTLRHRYERPGDQRIASFWSLMACRRSDPHGPEAKLISDNMS